MPKGELAIDWKDEVFAGAVLTHDGEIKNEAAAQIRGGRDSMIDGVIALYIFMLAAFTGYEVISRVPVILHTPLMSGSNFVHGIVLVGAMVALRARTRRSCGSSASSAWCLRPATRSAATS